MLERQFTHQETIHPTESELYEHEALLLQVVVQLLVYSSHQVFQLKNHSLYSRLSKSVVILDTVE